MPTNKAYFWKRVGLDYRFDIKYAGDIAAKFTVGILGLSRETIQRLTVWNKAHALTRARKIAVYGGYEKDGVERPLAEGIIVQAIPTSPPEMWLNFECLVGRMDYDPQKSHCVKNATRAFLLELLAKKNGLASRWDAKKVNGNTRVSRFYFKTSPAWMINVFASTFGVHVYIDGNTLVAVDRNAWMDDSVVNNAEEVGPQTGLLNIGNIDLKGATIRRRLDVRSRLMTWIRLVSKIMPSASNSYFVIGKRHVGQFRGQDWYTELQMIRRVGKGA